MAENFRVQCFKALTEADKISKEFLHPLSQVRLEFVCSYGVALVEINNDHVSALYRTEFAINSAYMNLQNVNLRMVQDARPFLD